MATVGQVLTAPEAGWRRYDDSDSRILKNGTWALQVTNANFYKSYETYTTDSTATVEFKFYGSKLRLIASLYTTRSNAIELWIDDVLKATINQIGTLSYQILQADIQGLTLDTHSVRIINKSTGSYTGMTFDAIDIDSTGYLLHPILNQVSSIYEMQIGDCIPCKYVANSGAVGNFSEVGTCTANEIPVTGTATPNGLFYLIKVADGLCICDRVIQTSISWDTLNAGRMIEGLVPYINIPTTGIIVTASTQFDTGHPASAVFDGTTTAWCSDSSYPNWLSLEFQNPTSIGKYSIQGHGSLGSQSPDHWILRGSNDGLTWEDVHQVTSAGTWANSEVKTFYTTNIKPYKYFKFDEMYSSYAYGAYVTITELLLYAIPAHVRLLSGGNSYVDASGNSSNTDQSLGAWPTDNEWDKYIVKSTLKDKITPSDNRIWHWDIATASWVRETAKLGFISATNTARITRGKYVYNSTTYGTDAKYTTWQGSNNANAFVGLRVVFEYIDSNSKSTTLFY